MKVIILAGGGGTRLYPLSTPEKPKQFLPLAHSKSLLVDTVERFIPLCGQENIIVVTGEKFKQSTIDELSKNNLNKVSAVYEPCARNTAPAIVLGVLYAKEILNASDDEPMFIAPSDHVIKPLKVYEKLVETAVNEAKNGRVVTLGIKPDSPNTGYGYICAKNKELMVDIVSEFKEKPDLETAKKYLADGNYFWNAGMFGLTYQTLSSELSKTSQGLFAYLQKGYDYTLKNFENAEKISIDYALAERSDKVSVVKADISWSDLGSWDAYYEFCDHDENGNVLVGNVKAVNCKNCLIYCDEGNFGAAGIEDTLLIKANGNTVVMRRGSSQDIRSLID